MEVALRDAKAQADAKSYFEGIQVMNRAFQEYEAEIQKQHPQLAGNLDILRAPEAFVEKALKCLNEDQKEELAKMYAMRAELLQGIGALGRAVRELDIALQLAPSSPTLLEMKKQIDQSTLLSQQAMAASGENKVPTSIITGFLGAGKTTLLNHILAEHHGKRIAVIENEFGEVGIDDSLLKTNSAVTEENIVEMNNGCICCTVRGDLIAGLKKLHKQTAGKGKPLDGILIETTGLADPAPVAQTFFADEFVQSKMRLDGILTVVDAKHCMEHFKEQKGEGVVNEAVEQVAFADRVLLNKVDLVSPDYLDEVEAEIKAINKNANIRRTENSKVDMDFIIGIQAFSLDRILAQVQADFLEEEEDEHDHQEGEHGHDHHEGEHGHDHHDGDSHAHENGHGHHDEHEQGHGHGEDHGHGDEHGHDDHSHEHGSSSQKSGKKKRHVHDYKVTSIGIQVDKEVIKEKFDNFLGWVLREKGPNLYRSKGVVAIKGSPLKFVFHAVHMQFGCITGDPWKSDEKRCCKLVFIGKQLDQKQVIEEFEKCLAP